MFYAILFVLTTVLFSFSIMSALLRYAEKGFMHGGEAVVHATVIATCLVGSVFVPALVFPAMVSTAFMAPELW